MRTSVKLLHGIVALGAAVDCNGETSTSPTQPVFHPAQPPDDSACEQAPRKPLRDARAVSGQVRRASLQGSRRHRARSLLQGRRRQRRRPALLSPRAARRVGSGRRLGLAACESVRPWRSSSPGSFSFWLVRAVTRPRPMVENFGRRSSPRTEHAHDACAVLCAPGTSRHPKAPEETPEDPWSADLSIAFPPYLVLAALIAFVPWLRWSVASPHEASSRRSSSGVASRHRSCSR